MNKLLLLTLIFNSFAANAMAVYGKDNRTNISKAPDHVQALGKSVAGIVKNHRLDFNDLSYSFKQYRMGLCSNEKFNDQYVLPDCTAFVVGQNRMLTAGHCVNEENFCDNNTFIFDYDLDTSNAGEIPITNTLKCSSILKFSESREHDYAIVIFEQSIKRPSLKIRKTGMIENSDELFVLGHPLGLPLIYSDNGFIYKNDHENYFVTDLDTFAGNSGSPVFNKETNEVEGILVSGADDVEYDPRKGCGVVLGASEVGKYGFNGETVTRILSIDLD